MGALARGLLSSIFWWVIVFVAVYELLITGQIWKVLKAEWRNTLLLKYIGVSNISIIEKGNAVMPCLYDQINSVLCLCYRRGGWCGLVRIEHAEPVLSTRTHAEEMVGSWDDWVRKIVWQLSFIISRVKTVFDVDVIRRCLSTILNVKNYSVI
jgi:hypothetical protein